MIRGKGVSRQEDVTPAIREGVDVVLLISPKEGVPTHVYIATENLVGIVVEKSGWQRVASLGSTTYFVGAPNGLAIVQKFKDMFPRTRLDFDFTLFFK